VFADDRLTNQIAMDDNNNQALQEWEAYCELVHQCLLSSVAILITVSGWLITSAYQKVPYHTVVLKSIAQHVQTNLQAHHFSKPPQKFNVLRSNQ
jgi:hypothetical protein